MKFSLYVIIAENSGHVLHMADFPAGPNQDELAMRWFYSKTEGYSGDEPIRLMRIPSGCWKCWESVALIHNT